MGTQNRRSHSVTVMLMGLIVLLGMAAGCESVSHDCDFGPPAPSELAERPDFYRVKAAILSDVRIRRGLHCYLDKGRSDRISPGSPDLPPKELEIITIREDPQDQLDAVAETALYSPSVNQYLYHYVGGPRHLDVWMGPYPPEQRAK